MKVFSQPTPKHLTFTSSGKTRAGLLGRMTLNHDLLNFQTFPYSWNFGKKVHNRFSSWRIILGHNGQRIVKFTPPRRQQFYYFTHTTSRTRLAPRSAMSVSKVGNEVATGAPSSIETGF